MAAAARPRGGGGGGTPRWKVMVWTGCFAAVTIMGTFYGAGLKTQMDWNTEKQKVKEATLEEKVALLEQRKGYLRSQGMMLEKKLADLHERMAITEASANKEGASKDSK